MNDEFLREYHREPPAELQERLRRRIALLPGNDPLKLMETQRRHKVGRARVVLTAGLAVLLLILLSAIFSPQARALMEDVVRQIGEIMVRETAIYPGSESSRTVIIPNEYMTLEEAQEVADFPFSLPAELPERYVMNEEIIVMPGSGGVLIQWKGEGIRGDALSLHISRHKPEIEYVVGPEGVTTVVVRGQEALFIQGGWNYDTQSWDPDITRVLYWVQDGLAYRLSAGAYCPDEADSRCPLTVDEMIHIAESVGPAPEN